MGDGSFRNMVAELQRVYNLGGNAAAREWLDQIQAAWGVEVMVEVARMVF